MKKIVLASLALVVLASCGNSGKPDLSTMSFEGIGTNPLWAFRYMDGTVFWETNGPNGAAQAEFAASAKYDLSEIKIEGSENDFEAKLKEEACTDGISDNQYTHSIKVKVAGGEYTGCAREYVAPEIQGAAQRSVTVETGSGTQATITNTAVQVDGQVVGAVTVSTGSVDTMEKDDTMMKDDAMMEKDGEAMTDDTMEKTDVAQ